MMKKKMFILFVFGSLIDELTACVGSASAAD
jgi:hypothetical protein